MTADWQRRRNKTWALETRERKYSYRWRHALSITSEYSAGILQLYSSNATPQRQPAGDGEEAGRHYPRHPKGETRVRMRPSRHTANARYTASARLKTRIVCSRAAPLRHPDAALLQLPLCGTLCRSMRPMLPALCLRYLRACMRVRFLLLGPCSRHFLLIFSASLY